MSCATGKQHGEIDAVAASGWQVPAIALIKRRVSLLDQVAITSYGGSGAPRTARQSPASPTLLRPRARAAARPAFTNRLHRRHRGSGRERTGRSIGAKISVLCTSLECLCPHPLVPAVQFSLLKAKTSPVEPAGGDTRAPRARFKPQNPANLAPMGREVRAPRWCFCSAGFGFWPICFWQFREVCII